MSTAFSPIAGTWRLYLPFTKPLSMNDRHHWATRARDVHDWRHAAALLARSQHLPTCGRIRVGLTYQPRDNRRRDAHNLAPSVKAAVDGLVDSGVVVDDTDEFVAHVHPLIVPGPGYVGGSRFELTIERLA